MTTTLTQFLGAVVDKAATLDVRLNPKKRPPATVDGWTVFAVPPDIDYRQAMRGGAFTFEFDVVFLVGAHDNDNQDDLLPFVDPVGDSSLRRLLDQGTNRTLGFPDVDCVALTARPVGLELVGGTQTYGYAVACLGTITNNQG